MNPLCSILLAPISWLYAAVVFVRNQLYREHLLPSYSVSVPTICVGNLAVGGTGKTPMVEYLIRMLSPDYHIAVLSRGYGRSTRGFRLVGDNDTAQTVGDEPMQLHQKFPQVTIAVDRDRIHGIHQLQKHDRKLQCVLLDDAFQYRRLNCGFYIMLTSADRLYTDDHYLPWGRLRDNREQALRANIIVVSKCPPSLRPIDKRLLDTRLHIPTFQHLYFSSIIYEPCLEQGTPLVITGIAHPEQLMEHIRLHYPGAGVCSFADHHYFSPSDIRRISQEAMHYDFVLTTEKDMTRLNITDLPQDLRAKLYTLPITIDMSEPDMFRHQICTYINENCRLQH